MSFLGLDLGGNVSPKYGAGAGPAAIVELTGLAEVVATLEKMGATVRRATGNIMRDEMKAVVELAQERYVPRDTEALKDSGFWRGPTFQGDTIEAQAGFGPSRRERERRGGHSGSEYAIPVHEINAPHQFGEWRYLQSPFLERMADFENRAGALLLAWAQTIVTDKGLGSRYNEIETAWEGYLG